ncbi:unnamed protein product [Phyllotreta striolata]|uniref:CLIP domain-containing serine protease n=1 Tax=Phyllotreta striolata TaxID=444603 RepID=A0A9N9TKT1_PHYSR|nr:unnamed protein product [Phyllotreta striolata]
MMYRLVPCILCLLVFWVQMSDEKLFIKYLNVCVPPKGNACVAIRQCPYFNDLLNNSPLPRPRNVIKIIRDHQCGFKRNTPYVCCDKTTPTPVTTTSTNAPEITTHWRNERPNVVDRFSGSLATHPNYYLLPRDICGAIKSDFRITNGQRAELNEYPWMALIFYNSSDGVIDFRCGGTIINERYVLTAAHCVVNQTIVGIRLGEYNVETQEDCESMSGYCAPPTQDFLIENVLVHPRYDARRFSNDIALIKLKGAANFNHENVQPICLPVDSDLTARTAIVTGWGVTEDGYKSEILQQANLPVVSLTDCRNLYRNFAPITPKQICAGGTNGRDSCGGDSGGPLKSTGEINGSMRFVQYGIVSFGPRLCGAKGKPGIYTRVTSFMKWILDNLEDY